MPVIGFPRRIIYDEPAHSSLVEILETLGASSVLVVTDPAIARQEFFSRILEALRERFETRVYDSVTPEPPIDIAEEIARSAREVDAVVAVGGGSVIDAAKAGVVLAKRPGVSLEDVAPFNPLNIELERPILVAVPTTAGTGSDASYGIVLTKETGEGREKVAVGSYEVIPFATVLDPTLPLSAPRHVRVGAMMDALSHAIESLASTASNPFSEALAENAARLLIAYGPRAVEGDEEAMARVHAAATMAGAAFTNSGLGLAHALAHPLGAMLGTHHGTTVGIVLLGVAPLYWESGEARPRLERLVKTLGALGLTGSNAITDVIMEFYEKIGAPRRFGELGVDKEKYLEAARRAAEEALHEPNIAFSPVVPSPEEMAKILEDLY